MDNMQFARFTRMALEWADEIGKLKGYDLAMVSEEVTRGFNEVQQGKNPDAVLKDVIRRVKERGDPKMRLN